MITRQRTFAALVVLLAHFCVAQPQTAKLKIRAALVDKELNVKPSKVAFRLYREKSGPSKEAKRG